MNTKLCYIWIALLAWATIASCGGGGGGGSSSGGDVTGLQIPQQVSLVEAQDVAVGGNIAALAGLKALTSDTSTAYYSDPLDVWVYDASMDALSIVNEILCSFEQTAYWEAALLNSGPYVALIDVALCDKNGSKESSSDNQSTGETEELEEWIVDSARASNGDPHVVSAWIEMSEDMAMSELQMVIHAKATITEAPSAANPYGIFHIDITAYDESEATILGTGYLESVARDDGQIEYQFAMDWSIEGFPANEAAHVIASADGSQGSAYTLGEDWTESGPTQKEYAVAFDSSHVFTDDGTAERCLDRVNYESNVFRYGAYNEDGSRLDVADPGFGVRYVDDASGITYWGFAGYYGLWMPDEVTLADGMTVVRNSADDVEESYTTAVAPGKFIRHTPEEITLADIRGVDFMYFDEGVNYQIHWDGTQFIVDGTEQCGENGCTWEVLDEAPLDLSEVEWFGMWRDGLGNVSLEALDVMSDATPATLEVNEVVSSLDGELTLYCFHECLKAPLTLAEFLWDGDTPFLDASEDLAAPHVFTISPADMTLKLDGVAVEPASDVTAEAIQQGPNGWGINSGAMVTDLSGIEDTWGLWGAPVFYTWETGPHQWNRFTGLLDSNGDLVEFSVPYRFNYTHGDGTRLVLFYDGFGELGGVPWVEDADSGRWYPLFTIPDGAEVSDGTNLYYVRALEMEQAMPQVDASLCSSISVAAPDAPSGTYSDPAIGSRPDVDDDPKVIKGVLQ